MTTTTTPTHEAPPGPSPRTTKRSSLRRDGLWPWLFVAPLVAGVTVFYLWPIVQTAWFSLTEFGVFGGTTFTGLSNYQELFQNGDLYKATGNTLLYTAIVLLNVPIAVVVASLLNTPGLRGASVYRVLYFLPYVAMPTAVAMVWRLIFNGDFGVLNYVLGWFGIDGPYWISTPGAAIVAVSVVGLWTSIGFSVIVLGAGLKQIPPELYEAAELDGASRWRQFRSITVPLLSPSIAFLAVVTVIAGFQLFDLLYAVLGTTNMNSAVFDSMSLVYLFYQAGFVTNEKGLAAAVAMVVLVLVAAATAVQFRMQKKWVHVD